MKYKIGDVLWRKQLKFKSEKDLAKYYEKKYSSKGYEYGNILNGFNISRLFQKYRELRAFELLAPKKHERILDVGCGTGRLTKKIAAHCKSIIGVDVASSALKIARKGAPANCTFRKMSAESLNFPNGSFDAVVSVETVEHVLRPKKMLKEILRVLKPNGRLAITNPTINKNIMSRIEIPLHLREYIGVSEHLNEWSHGEFVNMLTGAGFKLDRAFGIAFQLPRFIQYLFFQAKATTVWYQKTFTKIKSFPRNSMFEAVRFYKR